MRMSRPSRRRAAHLSCSSKSPWSCPSQATPRALVLAPTRELARQIVDVLRPLARAVDLRVDPFYGGTAIQPQHNALHRGVDIAVATPGRLIDLLQTRAIRLDGLQVVVI